MRYPATALCMVVIIQGCASLRPYPESILSAEGSMCLHWLEKIESTLEKYDLKDSGTVHLEGFPQLRVNRFLASMADQTVSRDTFGEWLELMRDLDLTGKKFELANLPASARQEVIQTPITGSFEQALEYCGKSLNRISANNAVHRQLLLEQAQVPDAYQSWKRVVGLYPLARYFAGIGIKRLHRELNASFQMPTDQLPLQGKLIRYNPPQSPQLAPGHFAAMLRQAYDNPLKIPRLSSLQLQQLFTQFAPLWEIDTRNNSDKLGIVNLTNSKQPQIDTNQPAVYVKHEYAHWHGKVLLQLIYQIWLAAREKTGVLDLYGGALDSVIWRVTLSPEGTPIAFDSIHGCGCYYMLFPGQGYRLARLEDGAEPVLSPKAISTIPSHHRIVLRLQSRTHYLQNLLLVNNTVAKATISYQFIDLDSLRSLPMSNGTRQSLYGEEGIIDASARAERLLLWPYGVASPGAMRQWGTHAIAFIGKRHFDDPFLFENLLDLE